MPAREHHFLDAMDEPAAAPAQCQPESIIFSTAQKRAAMAIASGMSHGLAARVRRPKINPEVLQGLLTSWY